MAKRTKKIEAAVPVISQDTIATLHAKAAEMAEAKAKAAALTKEVEAMEAAVLAQLKSNATVEAGVYTAFIEKAPGRFSYSWKDAAATFAAKYENLTPKDYEAKVRADNPVGMVERLQYTKLG